MTTQQKPQFRKPWHDWQTFGRAERIPDENTLPVVGDDLDIDGEHDQHVWVKIRKVTATHVYAKLGPAWIVVRISALRIGYTRMGTYRWETDGVE